MRGASSAGARRQVRRLAALGVCVASTLGPATIAHAGAPAKCGAAPATIHGTDGADHLVGTPSDDVIVAGDGADRIDARGGNDLVCAGQGRDRVFGDGGADALHLGGDDDFGDGGAHSDTDFFHLPGGGLAQAGLFGESGDDVLAGGRGGDGLIGAGGDDVLRGQADSDQDFAGLHGGRGADQLLGGSGDDELEGQGGPDVLKGGAGSEGIGFEMSGGAGDDVIEGGPGQDRLVSREGGEDELLGGRNADILYPDRDETTDVFDGGAGPDRVDYTFWSGSLELTLDGLANDGLGCPTDCVPDNVMPTVENVTARDADVSITGSEGANRISIHAYLDEPGFATILGLGGDDVIEGGRGNSTIDGGAGDDTLQGEEGDDALDGGPDDDDCDGGPDADTAANCETVSNVP